MITDATTTADFLFGFLLVHRNLGLSSKEHRDFWFSTTKMVSLSPSTWDIPSRQRRHDGRLGTATKSYGKPLEMTTTTAFENGRREMHDVDVFD